MDDRRVVTGFLRNDAEILVVRRSSDCQSEPDRWHGVCGPIDGDPTAAVARAVTEMVGVAPDTNLAFVRQGDPITVVEEESQTHWQIVPLLFDAQTRSIDPDPTIETVAWVSPPSLLRRETVPGLWAAYDRVRPRPSHIRDDTAHGAGYLSCRALECLRDEAARAVEGHGSWQDAIDSARTLRTVRPTMVAIANRINRAMSSVIESADPAALERAAETELRRAIRSQSEAAERAGTAIHGYRVATLSRSSTVCQALHNGSVEHVLIPTSRPGREGVAVAETLAQSGLSVTLTSDAGVAFELAASSAEIVLVGADRIEPTGAVINKVGTRAIATAASHEGLDVVVVGATDKIRPAGADGTTPDLEPRDPSELYDGPADLDVAHPTFDVTPSELIDRIITEDGELTPTDVSDIARAHRERAEWDDR